MAKPDKKTQIDKFQDAVRQLEEAPDEETFDAALKTITRTLGQDASNEVPRPVQGFPDCGRCPEARCSGCEELDGYLA